MTQPMLQRLRMHTYAASHQNNFSPRFPRYVPVQPPHQRPTYDAPGCLIRGEPELQTIRDQRGEGA